MHSVRTPKS